MEDLAKVLTLEDLVKILTLLEDLAKVLLLLEDLERVVVLEDLEKVLLPLLEVLEKVFLQLPPVNILQELGSVQTGHVAARTCPPGFSVQAVAFPSRRES